MIRAAAFIGAAIGVIGIAAAQAEPIRLPATDFSSQQVDPRKKKVAPVVRSGSQAPQQRVIQAPQQRVIQAPQQRVIQAPQQRVIQQRVIQPNVNRNVNSNSNVNTNKNFKQGGGNFKQGVVGPAGGGSAQIKKPGPGAGGLGSGPQFQKIGGPGQVQKFGGGGGPGSGAFKFNHGPGKIVPYQKANFPMVKVGNKIAPVWKGQKKFYYGGKWKTFVPLAAIGAVAIGGAYYYADGYLSLARPYCGGVTPEGCRLNWQRVEFEEGDSDWQCVQYCRRPGAPPPARTVALVAPPAMTQGSCEAAIFSEPGFGGTNATANDEQPRLSELGWRDQIASIKIYAGTWDFFNGEDFTGEVVRFSPGEYPDLGPEWSRKAGSFMCVQP